MERIISSTCWSVKTVQSSVLAPVSSFKDTSSYNDSIGDNSINVHMSLQMINNTIISLIIIIQHQSLNIIIKIFILNHTVVISVIYRYWELQIHNKPDYNNLFIKVLCVNYVM